MIWLYMVSLLRDKGTVVPTFIPEQAYHNLIDILFNLLSLAIVARALISWFNVNPYHPLVVFLNKVTEPILAPIRRVVPPIGMMDISPIVALILLQVIRQVLLALIAGGL